MIREYEMLGLEHEICLNTTVKYSLMVCFKGVRSTWLPIVMGYGHSVFCFNVPDDIILGSPYIFHFLLYLFIRKGKGKGKVVHVL
jgi:hypothetical protein